MDASEIRITEISPRDTYAIRQEILRPGRPQVEVQFPGDFDGTTVQLGAFLKKELVGIATFVNNPHKAFEIENQYQLRGMAVLPEVQKMHIGQQLLQWGESFLKDQHKTGLIWCNARESAINFYKKNKYQTYGDFFEIPNVCTHIVMFKLL